MLRFRAFGVTLMAYTLIIVASIDVWQSYLVHSSPIIHPVYILRSFVANSLLLRFSHFFGLNNFGFNIVHVKNCLYACLLKSFGRKKDFQHEAK